MNLGKYAAMGIGFLILIVFIIFVKKQAKKMEASGWKKQ